MHALAEVLGAEKVRRMAVLRRNGYGDLLMAQPLIHTMRRLFPQASLTLFLESSNAALLPYIEGVEDAVVIPQKGNKYWNALRAARRESHKGYDLAVAAKTAPMKLNNLFLLSLRARWRMAYVDEHWSRRCVNIHVPYDAEGAKGQHQALKSLHLFDPDLSEVPEELYPRIQLTASVRQRQGPFLQEWLAPLSPMRPLLLVSVSNHRPSSFLGVAQYARVLNACAPACGYQVVVSCMPSELSLAQELNRLLEVPSVAVPTQSFEEFLALLDRMDFAFVGDGGIMHLAAAMGKTQLVLFGKTSVQQWRPLSARARCLYHPEDVKNIALEEVQEALLKQWASLGIEAYA